MRMLKKQYFTILHEVIMNIYDLINRDIVCNCGRVIRLIDFGSNIPMFFKLNMACFFDRKKPQQGFDLHLPIYLPHRG